MAANAGEPNAIKENSGVLGRIARCDLVYLPKSRD